MKELFEALVEVGRSFWYPIVFQLEGMLGAYPPEVNREVAPDCQSHRHRQGIIICNASSKLLKLPLTSDSNHAFRRSWVSSNMHAVGRPSPFSRQ
jgi:hypothetical protein